MDPHAIIIVIFYLVILLYSVILHEISHGVVALWLGDHTARLAGRLTLNPRSHIDPIGSLLVPIGMLLLTSFRFAFGWARPVPYDPTRLRGDQWGPVMVAFAGPLTNMLLALAAALIASVVPLTTVDKAAVIGAVMAGEWQSLGAMTAGSLPTIVVLLCVITIFWNVLLGIFNLLPIPPLDGSRLLQAIVPLPAEIWMFLERWGFIILLGLVFIFPGVLHTLLTIGWSIFFSIIL